MPRRPRWLLAVAALLAGSVILGAPHSGRRAVAPEADEGGPYPSDWFGLQRAFPRAIVDQQAYQAAVQWARVERAAALARARGGVGSARQGSAGSLVWQEAGPFNIGGRVAVLAVAPGGSTVYLGAAAGGVFKSTNDGVNWTPVFDLVASIGALALDPADPATVYVGTGEANAAIDNYDGEGLFRSTDGGANWNYLGLEEVRRIARVRVDPGNSSRIFVAAMGAQFSTGPDRGLYRSEDGGLNWTKVLSVNDSTGVCDVVINPAHPETVYCASWERIRRPTYRRVYGPGCGIWRSIDHGTTWTRLTSGLPAPSDDVGRIGLAIAPSQTKRVYAQIMGGPSSSLNGLGLYRTDDGGATWTLRNNTSVFTSNFGGFGWYFGDVAVDPTNSDKVYCLGVGLIASSDGGANFSYKTSNAHVDFHALWIDPSDPLRIYTGNDGGFYSTASGGGPWFKSVDLPITQFYAGAVDPANPARILGGTQDNSTPIGTTPAGWSQYYPYGDGFYCLIDPTNSNIGFAESQNGDGGSGPQRTTDGGGSWNPPSGMGDGSRWNWCAPFVMDPSNHNVLLAGGYRVYRSVNNGGSYSRISNDLTKNLNAPLEYASTLSTLEISPANSNYYYAGTTDGNVWRSVDAGSHWINISAGLPVRWVTRLTADPVDAATVYVTLSGFSLDEAAAHVYRSTNNGTTWTPIDGNLPDVPANDILVDPVAPGRLFLATDTGVYVTSDYGGSWGPLGAGLPIGPVFDLTLHNASRTLIAATHGRSQWTLDLNNLQVAVGPETPPARLALSPPAPNPSRAEVRFELRTSSPGNVEVTVFDVLGRRVAGIVGRRLEAGTHFLAWDGRGSDGRRAAPGVYYVRASLEDRAIATRRIVRLD